MNEDLPDVRQVTQMLAKLHHESMELPDTADKFRLPVVTYEGSMCHDVSWCEKWEESFRVHLQVFQSGLGEKVLGT